MKRTEWMRMHFAAALCAAVFILSASASVGATQVAVVAAKGASPRELYGAQKLRSALAELKTAPLGARVLAAVRSAPELAHFDLPEFGPQAQEAFLIRQIGKTWIVTGSDASGVLYGELELADRIRAAKALPAGIDDMEHPALKLRGTCIGMQKQEITYDDAEYDYPYTAQNFPFFYDKSAWIRYLDMLAEERYNTLYLWNGHPFTSLLKLPKYPEAQELPTAQLEQNIALFKWLTAAADRRGIWVLQGFYNIHLSHTFARAHHLPYHLSAPNAEASAYTRYVISEFVREYPHAGLMMTLGEALSPRYGAEWLTQTIIPGVEDGLKELGITEEPPIVVRAHATDIDAVMKAATPLYSNIDTMFKWNGESLTWTNVRGPVLDRFKMLAESSNVAIANVHLLSNLEPFRWGDPDFIRQTLTNFQRIGIEGLHLYPLRYWDWPYAGDNTQPPLLQTDRDWIWFASWGRYAWNPNREPEKEHAYWVSRFAEKFGSAEAGEKILTAYTLAGPCQPKLLPRIGITEGNRQAFTLGMTMPQLIDPTRFNPAVTLWTGDGPPGERLDDYAAEEVKNEPHHGETPLGVSDETEDASRKAFDAASAAEPFVTKNKAEYGRVVNDMHAIELLMEFYNAKTKAAEQVLLYGYDHDAAHLRAAETLLAESVNHFRELTAIAGPAYRTATSMETTQRQIPFRGGMNQFPNWQQCLPMYEKELATFRKWLVQLSSGAKIDESKPVEMLPQIGFTLKPGAGETFTVEKGANLFVGANVAISDLAPELAGMKGIRISPGEGGTLHFDLAQPAQILVGFVNNASKKNSVLDPETEQWNLVMLNAIATSKVPAMAVWAKPLPAGANDLDLGKGQYVILGFIPVDYHVAPHVNFAQTSNGSGPPNLDWLFE
ncbi:MAG TPA: hypothetical protein VJX73_16485 [Terracidiphilus sp.]|nr:hypothetical protein [Terracidiphilus sp.]